MPRRDMFSDMQDYKNHRQYSPLFHFFAAPILGLNILAQLYFVIRHFSVWAVWNLIVACALGAFIWTAREMVTRAQDRIIRLEETLRLQRLLPADLKARIGELSPSQLIGLRFCSDEELPELTRAVLSGELRGREDIKRRIKNWRPDTLRV
jgi:Family of unknown function (DUF6526)